MHKLQLLVLATLVLLYLAAIQQVDCRIHRVKQKTSTQTSENSAQSAATSSNSRYDLYQLQTPKQPELPALNGVKPKFIFFPSSPTPSSTTLSKKSDSHSHDSQTALSAADYEGDSDSSTSIMSSLKARFGAKFGKDAQNKVDGGAGGGPPPDVFTRIGSVLGILGLGTLFIAELSSSFSAPFLIPTLMVPLTFVVLLRLAWDNMAAMGPGVVDVNMWM